MKKACFFLLLSFPLLIWAQERTYTDINNDGIFNTHVSMVNVSMENPQVDLKINSYDLRPVSVNGIDAVVVEAPDLSPMLQAGMPDLPHFARSLVIPDNGTMALTVVSSSYIEVQNVNVAPSKGNLLRTVNPDDVPYTFGSSYQTDAFFPSQIASLKDPYIFRDLRGQVVDFFPFQYNPVTKVLRVYTNIVVELQHVSSAGVNEFTRTKSFTSTDPEFAQIYSRHFLNYDNTVLKYTPVSETPGNMLIISYGSFITDMQPFVGWKIMKGIQTEIVDVATIGTTPAAIKTYVTNYYNTNGLTYLLLVGDFAQVTSLTESFSGVVGAEDIDYAYITGSDHYPEFLVGRFSAENTAHVQTMVARSIYYEKTPSTGAWYSKNIGIASDQGPGDDNEYDYQHMRGIQSDLLGFTYVTSVELFDGSQGGYDAAGNPTAANVTSAVNEGAGTIFYCGHGSDTGWGTTGFSNSNMSSLTNVNTLPFIYSVSCVIGHFNTGTCFCEGWMRAGTPTSPTGAIGIYGATINQSWNPPMEAEDEMADILVETYSTNIKRTFGGIGINGAMKMNDTYSDFDMTDTWTIFGDPSLYVRTKAPMSMTASHLPSIPVGTTTFSVDCNVNGAYVALTMDNQILATGYVSGGTANLTLPVTLAVGDIITVCATEFNYTPYIGEFEVINNNIPNDAAVTAIQQPSGAYACTNIQVTPGAVITNMGTNTLTSCTVELLIDGTSIQVYNWTGTLATLTTATISFNPITIQSGTHTILIRSSVPNGQVDGYNLNDERTTTYTAQDLVISADFTASATSSCSAPLTVSFANQSQNAGGYLWDFGDGSTSTAETPSHIYNSLGNYTVALTADGGVCGSDAETKVAYINVGADAPLASDVYACNGSAVSLSASASGLISWYDASTGGNQVGTGNSYDIPSLTASTTLYVENVSTGAQYNVGPTNNTTSGSQFTSAYEHYLVFDVTEACTLVSVSVNAQGAANRTITLKNASGATLQSTTVNVPDGVSRVTLNFSLTPGTSYRLCGQLTPNLFRSNAGLTYPYTVSGVVSITASSASTDPTGYYYYYYDWELQLPDCISSRTPVTAYVSVPQFDFSTTLATTQTSADGIATVNYNGGQQPFTYSWSDGQTGQSASGLLPGTYSVTVTDANGCTATGDVVVEFMTGAEIVSAETISVFPVPASNEVFLSFVDASKVVKAELLGITGKTLEIKPVVINNQFRFDVSSLSSGVYMIRVHFTDGVSVIRVAIE